MFARLIAAAAAAASAQPLPAVPLKAPPPPAPPQPGWMKDDCVTAEPSAFKVPPELGDVHCGVSPPFDPAEAAQCGGGRLGRPLAGRPRRS
jgi:hypothetical protein